MDNLQLTIELGSGVALGYRWINGEGIVARLALIDAVGREFDDYVARMDDSGPIDLREEGIIETGLDYTDGIAHASVSQLDTDRTVETTLYSSYDKVRAHSVRSNRPRSKIPIGGGQFKSRMIDIIYQPARRCTFYFRGDRERLEQLFEKHFTDLGKKTSAGFGRVQDWGFRTIDADYSVIHPTEDVAMRPIPVEQLDWSADTETLTYKTPYHYRRWARECAPPGVKVSGW
ncbi:hypothetical protein [Halocatena halophila]|uniref:hypothetical protein n=1 Tax=Halocatena halophila TaxID=2814576 RepID=UPI002ED23890